VVCEGWMVEGVQVEYRFPLLWPFLAPRLKPLGLLRGRVGGASGSPWWLVGVSVVNNRKMMRGSRGIGFST
jgi:hypothetical protein